MALQFSWDRGKARSNASKHRVSFEEAASAFGDPLSLTIDDPDHSQGEKRYILVGETYGHKIVVVSHAERGNDIRIISARMATRLERKTYEED